MAVFLDIFFTHIKAKTDIEWQVLENFLDKLFA